MEFDNYTSLDKISRSQYHDSVHVNGSFFISSTASRRVKHVWSPFVSLKVLVKLTWGRSCKMMDRKHGEVKIRRDRQWHAVTSPNGASLSVSCGRRKGTCAGGTRNPHQQIVSIHIREVIETRTTLLLCFTSTITFHVKRFFLNQWSYAGNHIQMDIEINIGKLHFFSWSGFIFSPMLIQMWDESCM